MNELAYEGRGLTFLSLVFQLSEPMGKRMGHDGETDKFDQNERITIWEGLEPFDLLIMHELLNGRCRSTHLDSEKLFSLCGDSSTI